MDYGVNDPKSFEALTESEQQTLLDWIESNFINGQFKGAMLKAGFKVKNPNSDNWYFNISMRSPAFKNND